VSLSGAWRKWKAFSEDPTGIKSSLDSLVPVAVVEDLTKSFNTDLLDHREAAANEFQAAVVAEFGHCQLFNPAGSGVLVEVTKCYPLSQNAGDVIAVGLTATIAAGAAGTVIAFRDSRIQGAPAAQVRDFSNAGPQGNLILQINTEPGINGLILDLDIILSPGNGINIVNANTNRTIGCSFEWTEAVLPFAI